MSNNQILTSDLMDALMKDPVKRALIIQLMQQEKDGFEAYKRRELKSSKNETPVKKVKRLYCESPTALQRRRALEKLNQDSTSEGSSSEQSEVSSEVKGPKLPFEELLKGVKAYVEVKRNNIDRSEGIKAVMKLMGATIRDQFTSDVTHVVFKDGSFTTYQKAKLMKVHLVSVLWLDAVRRNNTKVPEKNYPAFGSQVCDQNMSILCSQLQKDYEDVIKDEKRRTMSTSHKSVKTNDKNRRHTMMTPQESMSSYLTARKSSQSLFSKEDREVNSILEEAKSSDLTSDDSDCGVIDGQTSRRSRDKLDLLELSPSITDDLSHVSTSKEGSKNSSFLDSSGSMSLLTRNYTKNKRNTINIVSDNVQSTTVKSNIGEKDKSVKILQNSNSRSSMSSLEITSGSDRTKSGLDKGAEETTVSKSGSRIKIGPERQTGVTKSSINSRTCTSTSINKENCSAITIETSMSSLRLSDSLDKKKMFSKRSESLTKTNEISEENVKKTMRSSRRKVASTSENESKMSTNSFVSSDNISAENSSHSSKQEIVSKKKVNRKRQTLEIDGDECNAEKDISERSLKKSNQKPRRRSVSVQRSKAGTKKNERSRRGRSVSSLRSQQTHITEKNDSETQKNKKSRSVSGSPLTSSPQLDLENTERDDRNSTRRTPENKNALPEAEASPAKKSRIEGGCTKKTRKLYNPDDLLVVASPPENDEERKEHLKSKSKKSPDEIFLNPNNVHISPLKPKSSSTKHVATAPEHRDDDGNSDKRTKKKNEVYKSAGRDDDEQRELLELLSEKTNDERLTRRSERLSLSQSTRGLSNSQSTDRIPITPVKRRSTLDFQAVTQTQHKLRLNLNTKKHSSMVCTKMHRQEVRNFEKVVKNLGTFFVENQVSDKTTHLIAGECKRTINMLRAIARGCWILKHEWLLRSKEEGRWLPEEDYELVEFSPAVQQCRLQRQAFGSDYRMDIFKECGSIYVANSTTPKRVDLQELITTCQGKITTIYRNASIVVGQFIRGEDVICVTETWVLDSITFNKLKPFKNYLIKPQNADSPHY